MKKGEKMILVVGATGSLGGEICRRLRASNKAVQALTRESSNDDKLNSLKQMGVDIVQGDLKNPDSIRRAFDGVDVVVTTATSVTSHQDGDTIESVDKKGASALVDMAKETAVSQFVYISFPEMPDTFPLQSAKRHIETKLQSSDIPYTILRPTFFMETWLSTPVGFNPLGGAAMLYGDGDSAVNWISINDVAEAVVRSIGNPRMLNEIFDLGGPEALTQRQVVKAFEAAGSPPISLTFIPKEMLEEKRAAAADPDASIDPLQQSIDALMLNVTSAKAIDMTEVLERIPMPLTPVGDYIKTVLGK